MGLLFGLITRHREVQDTWTLSIVDFEAEMGQHQRLDASLVSLL